MKQIIAKHPHQFEGFMNVELFNKITELGKGTDAAILQFSQEHQIEYVGELAERWIEREIIKDEKDFVAMNLALALVSKGKQFLYNQSEIYAENTIAYIKKHELSTTALITLMYFIGNHRICSNEIIKEFSKKEGIHRSGFEHIFNIHLLTELYDMNNDFEVLHHAICNYLDTLELSLIEPFQDYTQLYLLSRIYQQLNRPKAQLFKTKGLSRLLQTIGNLRWKEVDWYNRNTPANVIGISVKDVITYNYILATNFKDSYEQKITGPGFERILENLLRVQYSDKDEFPNELVDDVKNSKGFHESGDYYTPSPFGKMLKYHLNEVPNHNLIHLMNHVSNDEFNKRINPDYIKLVKDNILDNPKQSRVVEDLLNKQAEKLKEEDFCYLEAKREELNIAFSSASQSYINNLIHYGYLNLEDTTNLLKNKYLEKVINYIKKNRSTNEYLKYLVPLEPSYYAKLEHLDDLTEENEVLDDETKKIYYQLKLKDVFTNKPTQYADTLCNFLWNDDFLTLFEYTAAEVEAIERQLYDNKMLNEMNHQALHKKLTPKEVLEAEYIKKAKKRIIDKLNEKYAHNNVDEIIKMCQKRPILLETLVEGMLKVTIINNYGTDLGDYLVMIYKIKTHLTITDEQWTALEDKAISQIIGKEEVKSA